tara:strand:- start:2376 stop:3095 length:720 start_codon:yes stop_codon:yes gene_type:complete
MKTTTNSFFVGDMDIISVSQVSRSPNTNRVINQAEIIFDRNGEEYYINGNRTIYKLLCILQHSEWVPKYFNNWKKNIQTMEYREFVHYICDILKQKKDCFLDFVEFEGKRLLVLPEPARVLPVGVNYEGSTTGYVSKYGTTISEGDLKTRTVRETIYVASAGRQQTNNKTNGSMYRFIDTDGYTFSAKEKTYWPKILEAYEKNYSGQPWANGSIHTGVLNLYDRDRLEMERMGAIKRYI